MPWNLPFQPDTGSQTSTLMSESLDGFNVAATRQNAGSALKAFAIAGEAAAPPAGVGGLNAPASIVCATVIVVFGSFSDARFSHDWGAAVVARAPSMAGAATASATMKAAIKRY